MSTGQTVIGFRSLDQSARQGFRVKLPEPDPIRSISLKATLLASGWTAGSDGRYQQTVTAEGVAEDTAVAQNDLVLDGLLMTELNTTGELAQFVLGDGRHNGKSQFRVLV
jgi:hypothetical protein